MMARFSKSTTPVRRLRRSISTASGVGDFTSSPSAALTFTVDTVAPASPLVEPIADPANSAYDTGFSVTSGAAVTVDVNGVALSASALAADFVKATAGGLDTYTAAKGAFAGTEALVVSATLTDVAGNLSAPTTLALKPIDTIAPLQPAITLATYVTSGGVHWALAGAAEANSLLTIFDGSAELGTATANSSGSWAFTTTENNSTIHDYTVTATDPAGNASITSAAYYEGTPNADIFNFGSEAALSAAALINGAAGTNTVQLTSRATLTDADFAHFQMIEILGLTGASSVSLGANALADGLGTINVGAGNTNIADSNSGSLIVNAASLAAGETLTVTGSTSLTIKNLAGNLNAAGDTGALTVTATGTSLQSIATGSAAISVADSTAGGGVTVDATALGAGALTLSGSATETVDNLSGSIAATSLSGALNVTAVGSAPQSVATGTGATAIADNGSGSMSVNALATGAAKTITLSGSAAETVASLTANVVATGLSGALSVTTKTTSVSIATGLGSNTINAGSLAAGQTLTLTGTTAATVTALGGNLTATGDSGALSVTTNGAAQTVTTGSNAIAITDNSTGSLTVNAAALATDDTLTLSCSGSVTVTNLKGGLNAAGDTGALTVTATGTSPQNIATGSGQTSIADSAAGGGVTVDATALGTGTLTLSGSAADTVTTCRATSLRRASAAL